MRHFISLTDHLNRGVTLIVGLLLIVVTIAVISQVAVRFVLTAAGINISAPWTEELARYCLIWMVFLGAAVGVRHARMIALEFGVRSLPDRLGVGVRYASILIAMGFFVLLFVVGLRFVELGRTETSPVMGITKDLVYWAMPAGAALMLINSVALIADTVLHGRDIRLVADHAPEL